MFSVPVIATAAGVSFDGSDSELKDSLNLNNYNHTVTLANTGESDRLVVVMVGMCQNAVQTMSSCTLNGTAGTIANYGIDGGRAGNLAVIYWKDAQLPSSNGDYTLNCQWGSDADASIMIAFELSGVDQTTPLGTPDTDTATGQTGYAYPNLNITGSSGSFALTAALCADDYDSDKLDGKTPPTGVTEVADDGGGYSGLDSVRLAAGYIESISSNQDFDWTETDAKNLDALVGYAVVINEK